MNSCLYECSVFHRRLSPKQHEFRYRIFMFALDLDELESVSKTVRGFGFNKRNVYEFRESDHLEPGTGSLKERLIAYLAKSDVTLPKDARIRLVTLPRVFGYIFNPVSFYFCTSAAGEPLCSVVQVGNTFGEMKLYCLPLVEGERFHLATPKHFYVSPFLALGTVFDFRLRLPGDRLSVGIDSLEDGTPTLQSTLTGKRAPLTTARLAWFTLKYPLLTLRVIGLIHWHALLLWLKRVPHIAKAAHPEDQRGVLRPHSSLAS